MDECTYKIKREGKLINDGFNISSSYESGNESDSESDHDASRKFSKKSESD